MRLFPLLILVACKKEEPTPTVPPSGELTLETPAIAAWEPMGNMKASGQAICMENVSLNGEAAEVRKEQWQAQVDLSRGINVLSVEGTDLRGDDLFVRAGVLAGNFAKANDDVVEAIRLRVNQGGLDTVAALVGQQITPEVLNGALESVNPVYTNDFTVADVTVDVSNVSFDAPEISITPSAGRLTLALRIPNLVVDLYVYGSAFTIDYDTYVHMGDTGMVGEIVMSAEARQGALEVQLQSATVDFPNFWYDTDAIPSSIEGYFYVDTIAATLKEKIEEQITTLVPSLIDDVLAGLDPSFSTTLLDHALDLNYSFSDLAIDNDGLELALDLDVVVAGDSDHDFEGYLSAPNAAPTISHAVEVSGAVSDDLLNKTLFEVWRAGLLDLSLSSADGSLPAIALIPLKATEGSIQTYASLPPVIVENNGGLQLQIGELLTTIDTPDSELGGHVVVAISGTVDLDVVLRDGVLAVELGKPDLILDVRESDWGASNETVTRLVEESLPLDTLLAFLPALEFPVPALFGLVIQEGTTARDPSGYHTDLSIGVGLE